LHQLSLGELIERVIEKGCSSLMSCGKRRLGNYPAGKQSLYRRLLNNANSRSSTLILLTERWQKEWQVGLLACLPWRCCWRYRNA